jgi:hypothetical protein
MAEHNAFIDGLKYQIKIRTGAVQKKMKSQVYYFLLPLQKQFQNAPLRERSLE